MKNPLVTVGVPIFNAEEFIEDRITSFINQTYENLEIIISDNASTDKIQEICELFRKKDSRIKYVRQEKNMGATWNFSHVLEIANGKYFTWAAADDLILPEFFERIIPILENNNNVSCCCSKIKLFGPQSEYIKIKETDSKFKKIKKRIYKRYGYMNTFSDEGQFKKKIREYFKNARHNQMFYGVYRTEQIKKSWIKNPFIWNDSATLINILEYGDLFVVERELMKVYDSGVSRTGWNRVTNQMEHGRFDKMFLYYPYTSWCFKKLEFKIFVSNFDFFLKINVIGLISVLISIIFSRGK